MDKRSPDFLSLLPSEAELAAAGEGKVPASSLGIGDVVLVRFGQAVPADGLVVQGSAQLDEWMLTGASAPVDKVEGDLVFAGSLNVSTKKAKSTLTVRVTAVGSDLLVNRLERAAQESATHTISLKRIIDPIAITLTALWISASAGAGLFWGLLSGAGWSFDVERFLSVLLIGSPFAFWISYRRLNGKLHTAFSKMGLIIRDRKLFEGLPKVKTVVFSAAGALLQPKLMVEQACLAHQTRLDSADQVLALAASVEQQSDHPVALAILQAAKHLDLEQAHSFESIAGAGARALVGNREVIVGGPAILTQRSVSMDVADLVSCAEANERGVSVIYVVVDGCLEGYLLLPTQLNPTAAQAVAGLQALGIRVVLLTGLATGVANHVARELGVDEVFAEVLAARKFEVIKRLQASGEKVAFVGDAHQDAAALAQADSAIAIGAGSDLSIETARLVLVAGDPLNVAKMFALAKKSATKVRQNFWFTLTYNFLAISVAAGALDFVGFVVSPLVSAVLMSLSTAIVVANAQLTRR